MRFPIAAAALAAFAAVALADAPPAAAPRPYAIGDTVADFAGQDLDGAAISLASLRDISPEKAFAAVKASAEALGWKTPKAEDTLDALIGTQDAKPAGGAADPANAPVAKRLELLRQAGKPFGLVAGAKSAEGAKTLGDVAKWIQDSASGPLVFLVWSPKCPVVAMYGDRIADLFAETGARLIPVAPNVTDSDDEIREYLGRHGYPFRVLVDREQKVTDLFGAGHTPHAFLLDAKNVLRYSGTIDDDAPDEKGAAKQAWLKAAIEVTAAGHGRIRVLMTTPDG